MWPLFLSLCQEGGLSLFHPPSIPVFCEPSWGVGRRVVLIRGMGGKKQEAGRGPWARRGRAGRATGIEVLRRILDLARIIRTAGALSDRLHCL